MSDSKYYRVIQETPAWEEGAILKGSKTDGYRAINDIWDTPATEHVQNYYESGRLIEASPEWFERVYDVTVLGKVKYLTKDAAKAAHEQLHKPKAKKSV